MSPLFHVLTAAGSAALAIGTGAALISRRRLALRMESALASQKEKCAELESSLAKARAQQAMSKAESQTLETRVRWLSFASSSSATGLCMLDPEGSVRWLNKAFTKILELREDEVTNKPLSGLLACLGSEQRLADQLSTSLKEGKAGSFEGKIRTRQGKALWLHIDWAPLLSLNGAFEAVLLCLSDQSEEKESHDSLNQMHERTELALAVGDFGVWEWMPTPNICKWDARCCHFFGTNETPANYEEWMNLVHRGDVHALETRLRTALLGNSPLEASFRVAALGGNTRYVSIRGQVLRDDKRKPLRVIGIIRDITDDISIREQLKLADERLQLSLMGANDGVWEWMVDDDRFELDDRWTSLIQQVSGQRSMSRADFEKCLHPEDTPVFRRALENQRGDTQGRIDVECRVSKGNADWVWVRWRGTVVSVDLAGKPMRICGTFADVSERKHTEEALRRSSLLLRQMCQQMGIAAWELNTTHFTIAWTEELHLLHGEPPDFDGSLDKLLALYPPEARRELARSMESAMEKRESFDIDVRWQTGSLEHNQWYRWTGSPVIEEDRVQAICGLVQDVTASREAASQRRELDSRMAELQQYEALSAVTDDLAYDLNSLLSSLLGLSGTGLRLAPRRQRSSQPHPRGHARWQSHA
jgi:PAS domain S-box-containing protein